MINTRVYLFYFIICLVACQNKHSLFTLIPSGVSGVSFANNIVENDSINPIDLTNIYNGGGVGTGDFNNDGLQDLYFAGNQVSNKLYLNKGNFKFEDVTEIAGVAGDGKWSRGISVVDINNDGWKDLYISETIVSESSRRKNLLYINQGTDTKGIPHFKEMAKEYGLDDTTYTTMAAFFDYDNDGDLDVYLVVNDILKRDNPAVFRPKITDGSYPSTGKLYRNDWSATLMHAVFTDVTRQTGVTIEGFGHGVNICDINNDGWKDIFVTNDFNSNDLLYINNTDGTFTDKASTYFKHTSANGMGQDVVDLNNDGLPDVVEVDMNPEDNYRKKMMLNPNSYQMFQNSDYFGYQYQYVRNTLQLNRGSSMKPNDSLGDPVFSDVGYFSDISQTDWSWGPLVTDFDNDGYRDIIISNGFPKDITDHDFITFRQQSYSVASKEYTLSQIPVVKIHNYAFRNNGDISFQNVTDAWGLTTPSFSNGGAYVDLDNDGDMDMVINNINDNAFIYRNELMNEETKTHNYVTINLKGDKKNIDGFGSLIEIYYKGGKQVYEQTPYRGYLSSIDVRPHFGLGDVKKIDSLIIKWPNNKKQVLTNVETDRTLTLDIKNANDTVEWAKPLTKNSLLTDVTSLSGITYTNKEKDYVDFNIQKLLPHKLSQYGPALAVGDIDGNGLDDIITGGSVSNSAVSLLQQANKLFIQKSILSNDAQLQKGEDMGITLFDVDGDGDLDMFIAAGGNEFQANSSKYQDELYINNGKGNFHLDTSALPQNFVSKSCVRAADYDKDGDLDLFIAGRVLPSNYPLPVSSVIYRNDTKNGVVKFTDVTKTAAKCLVDIGLVCDAIWTDFDNDGWTDLILAGEWMPVTFIKNNKGSFQNITASTGVSDKTGWWTSIVPGDFDNDGDMDYVIGNLGLNSFFKASKQYPVSIYAKDFDKNGSLDAIPTIYLPASQEDTTKHEYPVHTRDDMVKQMIYFRSKFQNYKSYANATFDKMFTADEMKGVLKLQANYFSNSYLQNNGNGKFTLMPLPNPTQYSCINGMVAEDLNGDGNLDILAVGNDYGTDVSVGRYDACNGLLLLGNGKGNFSSTSILQSGWFVPGDAKALVKLKSVNGTCLFAASQNRDRLKVFELKKNQKYLPLKPLDASALIIYKNGLKQKREFSYGSSFLSQSGRFINVDENVASVIIQDAEGNVRTIKL